MAPHVLLPRPWTADRLDLAADQRHHLAKVLRTAPGDPLTYTDGAGTVGRGVLEGGAVVRGGEATVTPPPPLVVAVAPPAARDRLRFLVEKLCELEVSRVVWLTTRRGEGRPPPAGKAAAWAVAALEQCRGAHLTAVDDDVTPLDALPPPLVVAAPGGGAFPAGGGTLTVAVGPEGGWAPGEVPDGLPTVGLGRTVLRVETAAVVAAVLAHRRGVDVLS